MEKKPFNYYAIRILNTVIFRRTVAKVTLIKSVLYKPNTELKLEQVTYTGGKVVGSMSYLDWTKYAGSQIKQNGCVKVERTLFRALGPYMQKGE